MIDFETIAAAIQDERFFQDTKHGTIGDNPHELGTWVLLIEDELREVKEGLIKGGLGRNSARMELVQVAALCVAALQQHGLTTEKKGRAV